VHCFDIASVASVSFCCVDGDVIVFVLANLLVIS
jgi:hypothetical protein